jgi:hypothetical protein
VQKNGKFRAICGINHNAFSGKKQKFSNPNSNKQKRPPEYSGGLFL